MKKFIKIIDKKGTSIFEVEENKKTMTRNILRFICDVGKQETEEKTQEVADLLIIKLNQTDDKLVKELKKIWK